MGIDLEGIDSTRYETILSQRSEKERKWVQAANREDTLQFATALWTAKEALSKVLCTGLMSPVQIYNLSEFTRINQGHYEGTFRNFGQYKTMT
jgi:4'-phosphopantetheinyl transferase